jgi:hypothetical protein
MNLSVVFVLLLLLQLVELKGRGAGGGGGGFKLVAFKKPAGRTAKTKQQQQKSRTAAASSRASESESKLYEPQKDYGPIFTHGLSRNSYIYNDYYRTSDSKSRGILQFLTSALFFRKGLRIAGEMNQYDEWDDADDHFWRLTTKAPYFENKIPGECVRRHVKSRG